MTTGEVLRVRAAMKPIATVPRALRTVDVATGEATVAHHQRSDVCAVPAAGIVAEAMVALVLADAVLEKFGGDSVAGDPAQRPESYLDTLRFRVTPSRRAGRPDGGRQDDGRRAARRPAGACRCATPTTTSRPPRAARSPTSSSTPARSDFRALERAAVAEALADHDGVLALGGGAVLDPGTRELLAGHDVVFLRVGLSDAVKRVGLGASRPLLLGNVRGRIKALLDERTPIYESVATLVGRHRRPQPRRGRRPRSRGPGSPAHDATPTIQVGGASPYDVVVGHGLADRLPALLGDGRRAGRACAPGEPRRRRRSSTRSSGTTTSSPCRCPTARRPRPRRSPPTAGRRSARPGSPAPTPSSPSAAERPPTSAASWPRPGCAASGSCTCRRRCSPWSTPRSAARPASTPGPARTWSASFHEPAGVLCDLATLATLPARRAGRRPRRGGQVRLHRRPGHPRPRRAHRPGRR